MKLIQPHIKCSGRNDVTCHYKGMVIEIYNNFAFIQFKRHGEEVVGCYNMCSEHFIEPENKDIKLLNTKSCCFD